MKSTLTRIMLVISGLIAGIVLAEILLAFFYPQKVLDIRNYDPFYGRFDPEIGWVNEENARGFLKPNAEEPGGHVEINGKGLRGREFPYERVPGKKRLLMLGDSNTFGYGLEENETYPRMLEEMLGEGHEVINAAVIGYGIDQEYLFFRREGIKYRPDIVIVGFSAGDIYDSTCSMRFGVHKPFFRLVDGRLRLLNSPVPEKVSSKALLERRSPATKFLFRASHLFRFFFYRLTDPDKIINVHKQEMNNLEGMRVAERIILEMKEICEKAGCRPVFLVIPQGDWIEAAERPGGDILRRGHDAAVHVVREADVPHIDLWEPFSARYRDGLFQKGDKVHTNGRGNRLIADTVYRSGLL